MSEQSTRTVPFRMPSADDLARRCEEANQALVKIQWALEDVDQRELVIDFDDAHDWIPDVRAANAALAIAAVAFLSMDKANDARAHLNSDEAPAEIDVARATKNAVTECGACGVQVNEQVEGTTRRLLASLDDTRRATLAAHYQDAPPEVLCAGCFNATAGVLNGVSE
jgi:hypothetical protein